MIRVAIVEKEETAKEIMFALGQIFQENEWTFVYFTEIVAFAKADKKQHFDIVFFHEKFQTQRISASFVNHDVQRVVIYMYETVAKCLQDGPYSRIMYINRNQVKKEMKRIEDSIQHLMKAKEEYLLSYHNITVALAINEIYYIEKQEKNVIYHSAKGEFYERKNMSDVEAYFKPYDFIRIHSSFLVNFQYITCIDLDVVELIQGNKLPLARARKKEVKDWFHAYVKAV